MAVWSKALPQTTSCLSPLPGPESWLEHVRESPMYVHLLAVIGILQNHT